MQSTPRLYIPDAAGGASYALTAAQNHHLRHVLRLADGARLKVFDGEGTEFHASLAARRRHLRVAVGEAFRHEASPRLAITLVAAISRATRMEWTLEKATEIGVTNICPVRGERGKVRLPRDRIEKRLAHWRTVMVAAAAQCGRARLPSLAAPRRLDAALGAIRAERRIALLPGADTPLPCLPAPHASLALLVGPESGFTAAELDRISATGWQPARLGPRTLRTETAGAAALAAVQTLWGDWRE